MNNLQKAMVLLDIARDCLTNEVSQYRVDESGYWLPLRELVDDIDHICEVIETYQKEEVQS